MSFTERVRNELAHHEMAAPCCARAELSAALRLAGTLHLRGGDAGVTPAWVTTVWTNAVARRIHSAIHQIAGLRPTIEVHSATGMRSRSYMLALGPEAAGALETLGVTDATLRPGDDVPAALTAAPHDAEAFIRGALMTVGSLSDPRRNPHLELRAPTASLAARLRGLVVRCGGKGARVGQRSDGWRVTCKSGEAIGAVLAHAGAHSAFLDWDAARMRRELRGDANRAANADRANVARAVSAAARQVATIEAAVASPGWQTLSDELRATALTRLANPAASLAELALLHDPPLSKATVYRRLARLEELACWNSEAGR